MTLTEKAFEDLVIRELQGKCSDAEKTYLSSNMVIMEKWVAVLTFLENQISNHLQELAETLAAIDPDDVSEMTILQRNSAYRSKKQSKMFLHAVRRRKALLAVEVKTAHAQELQIKAQQKQERREAQEHQTAISRQLKYDHLAKHTDGLSQACFFAFQLINKNHKGARQKALALLDAALAAYAGKRDYPHELFDMYRSTLLVNDGNVEAA